MYSVQPIENAVLVCSISAMTPAGCTGVRSGNDVFFSENSRQDGGGPNSDGADSHPTVHLALLVGSDSDPPGEGGEAG